MNTRVNQEEKYLNFNAEIMPHVDSLYRLALYLTGSSDDALDLLQDTLLKAFRYFDSYRLGSDARAWGSRIMRNTHINHSRRESRKPACVPYNEEIDEHRYGSDGCNGLGVFEVSGVGDMKLQVSDTWSRALQSLKEEFRTVVVLYDLQNYTYEEIACMLDISIGTVRSRLHRGRKLLRSDSGVRSAYGVA